MPPLRALIALAVLSFKVATGHCLYSASGRTTYDFVEFQTLNDTFVASDFGLAGQIARQIFFCTA